MATRMSNSKTLRPKTPNRGAADRQSNIVIEIRNRIKTARARLFGLGRLTIEQNRILAAVETELEELRTWIKGSAERARKRKGGLGRK